MNSSPLAIALIAAISASTSSAAAADTLPTAPGNLTATLYAGAGGEIFWNRSTDDRGVSGYEITKNGQSIGLRDALSFYDPSLHADTAYTFTVTAVDSVGQRSATSTVELASSTGPGSTPDSDAPASPAGLRGSVYSTTSVELFWTRDSTLGLRYEVRSNGMVLTTSDGTSLYLNNLVPGRSSVYQVITIDSSGRRSAPASVVLRTLGGSDNGVPITPVVPPSTGGDTLAEIQPLDVSIQIYSSTAAELFWTPAGGFRPVIEKNEIRRDGVLIATVQGEFLRSYFDDTREPDRRYSYEITAISSAGQASVTISDTGFNPPQRVEPPTATTPVSDLPAALQSTLDSTFEIINGVAVERVMATLGRLADRDARSELGLVRTESRVNINETNADVFSCPNGGELLDSQGDIPEGRFSFELEIIDCAIGSIIFSAFAQIGEPNGGEGFRPASVNAVDVELESIDELSTIAIENMFFFTDPTDLRFSNWSAFSLSVERPQNSYILESMSGNGQDQTNALPDGSLGFTATALDIQGVTAGTSEMRTLGPLEFTNGRENGAPSAGRLSIVSDSESLLIDVSNGDLETFTVTFASDGTTTSYTVGFSDAYKFEAPITSGVNIRF